LAPIVFKEHDSLHRFFGKGVTHGHDVDDEKLNEGLEMRRNDFRQKVMLLVRHNKVACTANLIGHDGHSHPHKADL
jgi:transcription initiation factor IIE alpha subunit